MWNNIIIIQKEINSIYANRQQKQNEFDLYIKGLDKDIARIRKTCSHSISTYHPDPSGNNDSSTTCNICGKEL